MPPIGIQTFYYGKKLPARAIAIAQVTAEDVSPADLIDIVNTPYLPGSLGIWTLTSGLAASPNFTAPDYNQSVTITGDIAYLVQNQFRSTSTTTSDSRFLVQPSSTLTDRF